MSYKFCNTDESRELYLYAQNTQRVMRNSFEPVARNLERKVNFDAELAVKAFRHVADYAAKEYVREFGGGMWHNVFSVACRDLVAREMLDTFTGEVACGNGWLAR